MTRAAKGSLPNRFKAATGGLRGHGGARTVLAVLAIALGVALGFAVQALNSAAVNELELGVQTLSGEADLEIRGPRGGFDERIYADVAARPEVAVASPAVEIDARLADRDVSLRIVGLDPFRAALIQPDLLPAVRERLDVLRSDRVFLSASAAAMLAAVPGDRLAFARGLAVVTLEMGETLGPAVGAPLGVMDIAAAQWRFQRLGRLTRIDLRLRPGVDAEAFRQRLAATLPPGVAVAQPQATATAGARLSRAYRVNLNVLALVALFTGGLLVFSTQALGIVRRRRELALLRVLGLTRSELLRGLIAEGALLGALGSALGLVAGYVLAGVALDLIGADLGSGFFRGVAPALAADPVSMTLFFVLGVLVAVAGSALPALEAARAAPAAALRAGDEEHAFGRPPSWLLGAAVLLAGGVAAALPPVRELPIFGYAAIALLLVGTLLLMPRIARGLLRVLPSPRTPASALALAQLRGAPGQASVSLASIVASISLMVSMAIMVDSFRDSLAVWLTQVLPADAYVRGGIAGDTIVIAPEAQARILELPGVQRVEFQREEQLLLDPTRPRVVLLARDIDPARPERSLALTVQASAAAPGDSPPVWVNEPAAALYGYVPGSSVSLPLGGRARSFRVAGIWRDYARQQGALVIERARYAEATGDRDVSAAALWLAPGVGVQDVRAALAKNVPGSERLEVSTPAEIRRISLRVFDRTFAVTYALELAAVAIGVAGLSSSFGARVLARRREFGVLRHLGMRRRDVAVMLATEGALVSGIGVIVGLALGYVMSLVLIHVVNAQSFHWSMELSVPWAALAVAVVAMLALASVTAVLSGRSAMTSGPLRAVREDW